jgi:hypothetical protein
MTKQGRKQGRTPILILCLLAAGYGWAATGRGGDHTSSLSPAGGPTGVGGGHGGGAVMREGERYDPRKAPPLARDRKVNEQDCRKPVDPSRGNLKCK